MKHAARFNEKSDITVVGKKVIPILII